MTAGQPGTYKDGTNSGLEKIVASGASIARRHRRILIAIVGVVVTLTIIGAGIAMHLTRDAMERDLRTIARETLNVQTLALADLMEKFRLLPNVVSNNPSVLAAFKSPNIQTLHEARKTTLQLAALSGAQDVVLLTKDGRTLVSGHEHVYAPFLPGSDLLSAVSQGRLGREVRYFENNDRAYVFAHGARDSTGQIIGIVAILVDLADLEQAWSLSTNPVFVVDAKGTILVSNRKEWRLKPYTDFHQLANGDAYYTLAENTRPHVDVVRDLPQLKWKLHVLADKTSVAQTGWLAAAGVALIGLAVGLLVISFANRQFAITRRYRRNRAIALQLERTVRDRTHRLTQSNKALAHEVEEHRVTETALRQMQSELIQTGKMAALGQMSTALAHEYNQPLAATKSYADNALVYLDRDRTTEARENIRLISEMADRMASISKHLRNFGRKPKTSFGSVPLAIILDDAMSVLHARIRESDAHIEIKNRDETLWVRGGHVRLQQVLVNLIANALDAVKPGTTPRVIVTTGTETDKVILTIRDFGTGIDQDATEQIFDPFFTTKQPGEGLGLGLSISFNIIKDFGGRLTAFNAEGGGAQFTLELERGDPIAKAAE